MATNSENLLELFDQKVRRHCRCVGRQVERLDRVTRVTGQTASQLDNLILWSDLDEATADREIDTHLAYFDEIGHDFGWFVYGHDEPTDLVERLLSRGLEYESEETVVVARSATLGEHLPPHGVVIRELENPADVRDSLAVSDKVWGKQHHDFVTRWLTELVRDHRDESTVLVAYDDKQPVGAAWATHWRDCHFANLFGGTVLPKWRGQGIYRAMVAARAKVAVARGIERCLVDAGPESFPILQRIGFTPLTKRISMRWCCE